jgi:type III secretion protein S
VIVMSPTNVLDITREALLLVLWVALPVVIVSAVVSLAIAVLQAVTQIQDQSIGQSVRIIAVLGTIALAGSWLAAGVLRFAERALQTLGYLG